MLFVAARFASPAPAVAHPFGPPLAATASTEGHLVNVRWIAAEDDWSILGEHLGVSSGVVGESGDSGVPSLAGAQVLAASDEVHDYLPARIQVSAVGPNGVTACKGNAERLETEVLTDGVELAFACPQIRARFDLTVTTLMDVHDAYRVGAQRRRHDAAADPAGTVRAHGPLHHRRGLPRAPARYRARGPLGRGRVGDPDDRSSARRGVEGREWMSP